MTNDMKSEEVLNMVREARKVIQTIMDTKNKDSQMQQALIFVLMLQSLEQLVQQLVTCETEEEQKHGLEILDDAIARLEDDNDALVAFNYDPSYNPNNRGDA